MIAKKRKIQSPEHDYYYPYPYRLYHERMINQYFYNFYKDVFNTSCFFVQISEQGIYFSLSINFINSVNFDIFYNINICDYLFSDLFNYYFDIHYRHSHGLPSHGYCRFNFSASSTTYGSFSKTSTLIF